MSGKEYVQYFLENEKKIATEPQRKREAALLLDKLKQLQIYTQLNKLVIAIEKEDPVFGGNLFDSFYKKIDGDCSKIPVFGTKLFNLMSEGAKLSQIFQKLSRDTNKIDWMQRLYFITKKTETTFLKCIKDGVNGYV